MVIKKVNILYGRTVNVANRESFRVEMSAEIDLVEQEVQAESVEEVKSWLRRAATKLIESEIDQFRKEKSTVNP